MNAAVTAGLNHTMVDARIKATATLPDTVSHFLKQRQTLPLSAGRL